nr:MAG TPA: hypothetical protein [Caudoviricetes sp.]
MNLPHINHKGKSSFINHQIYEKNFLFENLFLPLWTT